MIMVFNIWDDSISNARQEYFPVFLYTVYKIHENGYKQQTDPFHVRIRKRK